MLDARRMIREADEMVEAWHRSKNANQNNSSIAPHGSLHQMMTYNNYSSSMVSPTIANAAGSFLNSTTAASQNLIANSKSQP